MQALSREDVAAAIEARANQLTAVEVEEWGGSVYLRRLSIEDVESTGLMDGKRDVATITNVLGASICAEDGTQLFAGDASLLRGVDVGVLTRIFTKALEVNGLMSEDLEKAVADFELAQPEPSSSS